MGRHRQPDELKFARGNPRKERLGDPSPTTAPPSGGAAIPAYETPEYLTEPGEIAIFRTIVDDLLPRNVVQPSDFNALGRYATDMQKWIEAKADLGRNGRWYKSTSKHGELLRRNPAFQDMIDLGHELRQAEQQLGLTPMARGTIIARLRVLGPDPWAGTPLGDAGREGVGSEGTDSAAAGGDDGAAHAQHDSPLGALALPVPGQKFN